MCRAVRKSISWLWLCQALFPGALFFCCLHFAWIQDNLARFSREQFIERQLEVGQGQFVRDNGKNVHLLVRD